MKKYMLLHYGFKTPTPEIMDSWNEWFDLLGDKMLDMGGLTGGREISHDGIKELKWDMESITGYNIIEAENINEAEEIAKNNPFIASIRVYEIRTE